MRSLGFLIFIFIILSSFSYKSYQPSQTLDTHMSPREEKDTGVDKLTPSERQSLQEWINRNHYARMENSPYKQHQPEVSEVLGNGSYVKLSDNSLWQIHPNDRPITQGWISAANIFIEKNGQGSYPYTLKNSITGSVVRAQSVQTIPEYLIHTPKQPQQNLSPEQKKKEAELKKYFESPTKYPKEKPSKQPPSTKPSENMEYDEKASKYHMGP